MHFCRTNIAVACGQAPCLDNDNRSALQMLGSVSHGEFYATLRDVGGR